VATSPNDGPLFGAWTYSLNHHLGNSISNSWINYGGGVCPSTVTSILKTATKAHVTVLAASGDTGAWGYKQSTGDSYPADCPQVLTVGGTTLAVKSGGTYSSESAWGGAGGGYVTGVKEAKYQVYAEIKDSPHLLGKSDVSADANPGTGVWVYDTPACGGWCVVGGTSVACPLWAAFIALANQIRAHHGFKPAGFLEPFLYTWVYGKGGTSTLYHSDFHDVKVGSDGWPAGKGWDVPTGLGSFIGAKLAPTIGDNSSA
jgi:subtilase family serine protease